MPAMPIQSVKSTNPYPGGTTVTGTAAFAAGGTYGLIDPVSDGFFGTMSSGQEVYSFLGLGGANKSNSFTNWAAGDEEYVDLTVTGFAIHVFALNADLGHNGLINVSLVKNVPKGTFVIAYSQGHVRHRVQPSEREGLLCTVHRVWLEGQVSVSPDL